MIFHKKLCPFSANVFSPIENILIVFFFLKGCLGYIRSRILALGTVDILGQIIPCRGTVPCIVRCLVAPLPSTH